ncbi:hypothetical protein CEP51_014225 [Fusarium floridanum]|uniref:Uncharacterized protein n=1 Tax=Fusarium floridanum TaxID=1325733 RepID=A0A428PWU9_9HYPO|nr:hypothetical protein CEP51_014225 [Fusarium floridanum]
MQDASPQAPLDCLAQRLHVLSIQASQGSFELDQVRTTKVLLEEIEEGHRHPVSYLLANYNGPLGSQHDPDIDCEIDTDIDTTTEADTNIEAPSETDINSDTSSGYVSDSIDGGEANTDGYPEDDTDGEGDLHIPLHEYILIHRPKEKREELMYAVFVHQFVTKGRIDPRPDLEGLIELDLQGYTHELVECIAKQLALGTDGMSTTAILDKAMDQYKTWHRPLGRIEEPVMLQKDFDEVETALSPEALALYRTAKTVP